MFDRFILQLGTDRRHASLTVVKHLNHRPYRANCVVIVRQDGFTSVRSDGGNRFDVVPFPSLLKSLLTKMYPSKYWTTSDPSAAPDGSEIRSPDGIVALSAFRGSGEMADTP